MPELPEVQTIVDYLSKKVVGLYFTDAWTDWPKSFRQSSQGKGSSETGIVLGFELFKKAIKNKKILNVRRRAKFIIIDIEGSKSIFIHQKISGHLLYGKWKIGKQGPVSELKGLLATDKNNQYIRSVFYLSNGWQIGFSDLRRFGRVILIRDDEIKNLKEIHELGPEPLTVSEKDFVKLFSKKKGRIKQVLMDPTFIAGIGNIYGDEILWRVGLHPLSRVENLNKNDLKKLYTGIRGTLKDGIRLKGTSIEDYRIPSGEKGSFQTIQKAYHRTGDRCAKKDNGIIKRIKLGGRSAHFCSKHQILK